MKLSQMMVRDGNIEIQPSDNDKDNESDAPSGINEEDAIRAEIESLKLLAGIKNVN